MGHRETYIPALGFDALTPWYDAAMRWVFHEELYRLPVVEAAALQAGQRVLDLGCGTGTLTVMLKQAQPLATVAGLDIDARTLELAQRKARRVDADIEWVRASAARLPYADATFDSVVSSAVIHHLTSDQKRAAFAEVYRVLRPGGSFHLLDFAPPRRAAFQALVPLVRGFERVDDNVEGRLPGMLREASFTTVEERGRYVLGALALWRAAKG